MVFLQCECAPTQFKRESQWVTQLSETEPGIQGIVPWAPLEKGEPVRADLEELAQNKLIKGIRRIIQFEQDIDFCLKPTFITGVQMLAKFNFSFDICISHAQLANTITLVRQCPRVHFILDHIGKPDIKNQGLDPWRQHLRELSGLANVWCKVSGLVTEADHKHWTKEDLKPYIGHVIECFGFDRVMFGGDWPVAAQATEYARWVETLQWALSGASDSEVKKLFCDNAMMFYRLE